MAMPMVILHRLAKSIGHRTSMAPMPTIVDANCGHIIGRIRRGCVTKGKLRCGAISID
jgi:hypothetical protein